MTGVLLVLIGWTWIGFIVETYGFWLLFKGFIPTALTFFRRVPILGKILDLPILKSVSLNYIAEHRFRTDPRSIGSNANAPGLKRTM